MLGEMGTQKIETGVEREMSAILPLSTTAAGGGEVLHSQEEEDDEADVESSELSSLDSEDMSISSSSSYEESKSSAHFHHHAMDFATRPRAHSLSEDSDSSSCSTADQVLDEDDFYNVIKEDAPAPLNAEESRLRTGKELEMIATLVPARLLYAQMNNARGGRQYRNPRGAIREEFDGAVLFADISGFSKLAESLVARNINASNAAENLVKYVGWNLNEMVEVICNAGGDCMKFAGDAILAVFAADQFGGSLEHAAYYCAQAALALQGLQLNAAHEARLSIHSGMGVGRVATYEVGGILDRWEIFVAGSPVEQIGRCEPLAKSGQLVVSFESRICIEKVSRIEGEMVEGGDFRLDRLVDVLPARDPPVPAAVHIEKLAKEDPERAVELKRALMKYVSRPVIFSIEGHAQSLWGAELRDCSTLFCKFKGLNFMENSEEDLAVVQYVVRNVVQKVMQSLEGTVCRFMVDDKGASMLLAFGLVPYAHVNDPVRAVKAALLIRDGVAALSLLSKDHKNKPEDVLPPSPAASAASAASGSTASTNTKSPMRSSFRRESGNTIITSYQASADEKMPPVRAPISCQIGITHGRVCVGMVGGTTRCEYTLHGVLVNRAARLMGLATDGVVLCDYDAYSKAKSEVEFDSHPTMHRLKGERNDVQVFKALKKASGQSVASTKSNNLVLDTNSGLVGRKEEKLAADKWLLHLNGELPWTGVVGIKGETGIGKSLMLQYVAKRAQTQFRATVLSGFALDTETSTPFFAWKNLVIQLISSVHKATAAATTLHAMGGSRESLLTSAASFTSQPAGSSSPPTLFYTSTSKTPTSASSNGSSSARRETQASKSFAEMTQEERKECLIQALPLEKREYYPLLAPFVDEVIPSTLLEDNEISMNIVRAQRSQVAMETVVSMLANFANLLLKRNERLVLVLDDIQWMDELSLELLQLVVKMPRLAVFVAQAEERALFSSITFADEWHLKRLERQELSQAMSIWLKVPRVEDSCMSFIFDRTNGNPLFSEELCALMLEKRFFELIRGTTCILRNLPDSESLHLTSSIQSIMTTSLDRLTASQQIVVRVVAMMGMQCTLHDLGGVFREINARSTTRLLEQRTGGGGSGGSSAGEESSDEDEDGGYFSLADVLKQGYEEPKAKEQKEPAEARQRLVALFTSINVEQVVTSLVEKGTLEAKQYGNRTVYVFRHLLMKHTCLDGLRAEVKQVLHTTIALYYESRPTSDLLSWYTILAEHFYAAKRMKMKALKYLQLAGNLASENHAHQQVYSIYRRLVLLNNEFADEIAVSDLSRAQWNRKVAESLFHLNETYHAERLTEVESYLYKALVCLGLDIRTLQGMSGTEAGFLPPPAPLAPSGASAGGGGGASRRSSVLRSDFSPPSPLFAHSCMRRTSSMGAMNTTAAAAAQMDEDLVREIPSRRPPPTKFKSLLRAFSFTSDTAMTPAATSSSTAAMMMMLHHDRGAHYFNGEPGSAAAGNGSKSYEDLMDCAEDIVPFVGEEEIVKQADGGGWDNGLELWRANGMSSAKRRGSVISNTTPQQRLSGGGSFLRHHGSSNNGLQSTPALGGGIGNNASSMRGGLLLHVDPSNAGMRPRLVLSLRSFNRLKAEAAKVPAEDAASDAAREARNDAIESLLEAAAAYDLLSTLKRDRNCVYALERRLNVIILAEAAAEAFANDPHSHKPQPQPSRASFGGGGGGAYTSFGRSSNYRSGNNNASQTTGTAAARGSPTTSALHQRIQDTLSRAYSRAALFFAGMPITTRWRDLGYTYAAKANNLLRQHRPEFMQAGGGGARNFRNLDFEGPGSSSSQYSENIVNLHRRCGKWDAIQGNFVDAKDKLRYAAWGAKFMHLESMFDAKALELAVFFFNGDLDSCNRNASDLFEKNTPARFVAIGARFMALCGAYDVAVHKLTTLTGGGGGGYSELPFASLEPALHEFNDANAWLALSLVAWRVERDAPLALRAVTAAAECALKKNLDEFRLNVFHELALCFTALWDPIREQPGCVQDDFVQVQNLLARLTSAVQSYGKVYRVCRPHAKYCIALRDRMLILGANNFNTNVILVPIPPPSASQLLAAEEQDAHGRQASAPLLFSHCCTPPLPPPLVAKSSSNPELLADPNYYYYDELDPFLECARFAQKHECFWVQGLALLEVNGVAEWLEARNVFVAYEHASYELARCDRRIGMAKCGHKAQLEQQPPPSARSSSIKRNTSTSKLRSTSPELKVSFFKDAPLVVLNDDDDAPRPQPPLLGGEEEDEE